MSHLLDNEKPPVKKCTMLSACNMTDCAQNNAKRQNFMQIKILISFLIYQVRADGHTGENNLKKLLDS